MVSHCRLCSRCYVQIDHHCLYLYRCIAIANHRLFVLFTAVVVASMLVFEYSVIVYLRSVYVGKQLSDWSVISAVFATSPMIWSLFILNGMSIVWATWVLHAQIVAISKGRLRAYQSYKARSWLSKRQRLMNVVHFFLNKSPHVRDEVSEPWCLMCVCWLLICVELEQLCFIFSYLDIFVWHLLVPRWSRHSLQFFTILCTAATLRKTYVSCIIVKDNDNDEVNLYSAFLAQLAT